MRGLSIVVFLAAMALVVASVPVAFPGYNDGNGIPTSAEAKTFINKIAEWQIAGLTPQFTFLGGNEPTALDLAVMTVMIIWIAITGFISICSVILFAYPIITTVFPVPPAMGALIQMVIWVSIVVAAAQVYRGVPWGINE